MRESPVKAATAHLRAVAVFFALGSAFVLGAAVPALGWTADASPATAHPLPTLARHAPPSVPHGYVITPFGYFHPSCVRAVARGEILLGDGRIQRADGTRSPVKLCRYPHYTKHGARIEPGGTMSGGASSARARASKSPEADGWLEASWYNEAAPFGGISANWVVPSGPGTDVGQVLYYFPGLEDYENVVTILQPVLGWNGFDDHAWSISSWNCCTSGNANYSTPQGTATGDEIVGTVSGNCAVGSMCSTWNIATVDKTNGHTSTLEQTSSYGQRFDWAFAGVVEVYGVSACDQYSSNGFVDFTAVSLLDLENRPLSRPGWTASGLMQDNAPPCDYGVTIAPTSASLSF